MGDFSHVAPELRVVLRCLVAVRKRLAKRYLVLGVKDVGRELGVLHLRHLLLLVPQLSSTAPGSCSSCLGLRPDRDPQPRSGRPSSAAASAVLRRLYVGVAPVLLGVAAVRVGSGWAASVGSSWAAPTACSWPPATGQGGVHL